MSLKTADYLGTQVQAIFIIMTIKRYSMERGSAIVELRKSVQKILMKITALMVPLVKKRKMKN